MSNFPDITPIETEYVEYSCMQPHEFTCPKCKNRFYSDVPQITIICKCGAELIRKDFEKGNVFAHGRRLTPRPPDEKPVTVKAALPARNILSCLLGWFSAFRR